MSHSLTIPAADLAAAWLNATLASSDDEDRPALYRTTLVELFDTGVHLVSTDSYMLLGVYVPTARHDLTRPPGYDEAPNATYIVQDHDRRCIALMRHMRKAAAKAAKESRPCDITISFRSVEADTAPTLDPTLDRKACVISTEREQLTLSLYEGQFPTWRQFMTDVSPAPIETVSYSPMTLGRLGKLVDTQPAATFTFQGANRMTVIEMPDSYLFGGVMPVEA